MTSFILLMKGIISINRGDAKRALEGIGTNGFYYPTALKLLKVCHLNLNELFEQPQEKKMVGFHCADIKICQVS